MTVKNLFKLVFRPKTDNDTTFIKYGDCGDILSHDEIRTIP